MNVSNKLVPNEEQIKTRRQLNIKLVEPSGD